MFTAKHVVVFENGRGAQKKNVRNELLLNVYRLKVETLIFNNHFNCTFLQISAFDVQ